MTSRPFIPKLTLFAAGFATAADMTPDQRVFFENKIRPVLVRHCYECHSQDAEKPGGGLLLDGPSEMLAGGVSGPALIAGEPDESLIVQAVRYQDLEMPPKTRLPEAVVADFAEWVRMGAPDPRPPVAAAEKKTPQEKLWWLEPVKDRQAPMIKDQSWPQTSLDAYFLAALEDQNIPPAPRADEAALRRRLSYDLTGLPPSITSGARDEPLEAFVDTLLNSPHFGEKWGRHWLDVARYAESNGNDGLSRNPSFPHAWRYRDYVIRAFNDDMPYDRFILEQIAGDLLPAETPAQRDQHLIATGFLALCAKPAKAMNENFEMDVVADQIDLIGRGLMGLTLGCARCHDHKTDPVTTRDYYALAGIFKSTETMWGAAALQALTAPQTPLHMLASLPGARPRAEIDPILKANPPRRTPAKPAFNYTAGAALAMGVRDAKKIADCQINIGGESKRLGPSVPRGFVAALGASADLPPLDDRQSGRLQLAQWIASPSHPLTARVMVNRVWQHLFGEGIVPTPDDFGRTGGLPSNPAVLDHLAARFMREGWSVKRLIRAIVLSSSYQRASGAGEGFHHRRRLTAEEVRDTMLAVSGDLNPQPGQGSLIQERDVLINELPPLHQPSRHRSVYLLLLRNALPSELTPFNLPDATVVTGRRDDAALATQALYLLNHPFIVDQARKLAARAAAQGADIQESVRHAYCIAFGRNPTADESQRAADFTREAGLMLTSSTADENARTPPLTGWEAFCQALLASNELRYLD